MTAVTTYDISIIGAGIAGFTAAIGLRKLGHNVRLLERSDAINPSGAAIGLWPAAQDGLERLGVMARLAEQAVPYRHAEIRDTRGRAMAELPVARIERTTGKPVVLVGRPVLMAALVAEAADAGVHAELAAKETLVALLNSGTDLVVGADGIRSATRSYVDPGAGAPRSTDAVAWRGSCDGRSAPEGEVWGRGMFAGVTAGGPELTNWYVAVHRSQEVGSFAELKERVASWPDPVPDVLDRTKEADVLRHEIFDLPRVGTYVRGKVALIGDAAHAMTPSLGQGACQAILDSLALISAVDEHPDIHTALAAYDAERRPVGRRFVRGSRLVTRIQFAGPATEGMRNALLRGSRKLLR